MDDIAFYVSLAHFYTMERPKSQSGKQENKSTNWSSL